MRVVERAADVDLRCTDPSVMPTRWASVAGIVALVRMAVRFAQIPLASTGPTSSGAISNRAWSGLPETKAT